MEEAPNSDPKDELLELASETEHGWNILGKTDQKQEVSGRSFYAWSTNKVLKSPGFTKNFSDVRIRVMQDRHRQTHNFGRPILMPTDSIKAGRSSSMMPVSPQASTHQVATKRQIVNVPPRTAATLPTIGLLNLQPEQLPASARFRVIAGDGLQSYPRVRPPGFIDQGIANKAYSRTLDSGLAGAGSPRSSSPVVGLSPSPPDPQNDRRMLLKVLQSQMTQPAQDCISRPDEIDLSRVKKPENQNHAPIHYFKKMYSRNRASMENPVSKKQVVGANLVNGSRLGKHFFAQGIDRQAQTTIHSRMLERSSFESTRMAESQSRGPQEHISLRRKIEIENSEASRLLPEQSISSKKKTTTIFSQPKIFRPRMIRESQALLAEKPLMPRVARREEADSQLTAAHSFSAAASPIITSRAKPSFFKRVNSQNSVEYGLAAP